MSDDMETSPRPANLMAHASSDARTRASIIVLLAFLLLGFVSLVWTPHPLDQSVVAMQLRDPSLVHLLGTDAAGRDVLSVLMRGLLTSYIVAVIGVAIGLLVGVPLGLAAVFLGQTAERLVLGAAATLAVIPALVVAAALTTLSGPGPINVMAAIGVAVAPILTRVTRDALQTLLGRDDIAATRLAGFGRWDATMRHAVPALGPALLAQATVLLGYAVIAEAAFSFAGLGARADGASLGLMLREALAHALFEPRLVLLPGLAIALVAGALHVAAEGLRRHIAPELRAAERDDALA